MCWVTFVAILGCLCPVGHSMDIPKGWGSWTTAVSSGLFCLESQLRNTQLWPEIRGYIPTSRMALQNPLITGSMVTQSSSGHTLGVGPFMQALKCRMSAIHTSHLYSQVTMRRHGTWLEVSLLSWIPILFLPRSYGSTTTSSSLGFLIGEVIHYQAQRFSRWVEIIYFKSVSIVLAEWVLPSVDWDPREIPLCTRRQGASPKTNEIMWLCFLALARQSS